MSSKTKIVVFKMKELVLTVLFLLVGILVILFFLNLFSKKSSRPEAVRTSVTDTNAGTIVSDIPTSSEQSYIPGVYHSTLQLGDSSVDLAVWLDADRICSISFEDLPEETAALYPLLESTLHNLTDQIVQNQSLEVSYSDDTRYTSQALLQAIQDAIRKSAPVNPS